MKSGLGGDCLRAESARQIKQARADRLTERKKYGKEEARKKETTGQRQEGRSKEERKKRTKKERKRDRQIGRQAGKQADGQADRRSDSQTERKKE